jgi:hypothetical protein
MVRFEPGGHNSTLAAMFVYFTIRVLGEPSGAALIDVVIDGTLN